MKHYGLLSSYYIIQIGLKSAVCPHSNRLCRQTLIKRRGFRNFLELLYKDLANPIYVIITQDVSECKVMGRVTFEEKVPFGVSLERHRQPSNNTFTSGESERTDYCRKPPTSIYYCIRSRLEKSRYRNASRKIEP